MRGVRILLFRSKRSDSADAANGQQQAVVGIICALAHLSPTEGPEVAT